MDDDDLVVKKCVEAEEAPNQIYSRELDGMIFVQPCSKISFLVDVGIEKTADCGRISAAA